jgi:hypothetical protein
MKHTGFTIANGFRFVVGITVFNGVVSITAVWLAVTEVALLVEGFHLRPFWWMVATAVGTHVLNRRFLSLYWAVVSRSNPHGRARDEKRPSIAYSSWKAPSVVNDS